MWVKGGSLRTYGRHLSHDRFRGQAPASTPLGASERGCGGNAELPTGDPFLPGNGVWVNRRAAPGDPSFSTIMAICATSARLPSPSRDRAEQKPRRDRGRRPYRGFDDGLRLGVVNPRWARHGRGFVPAGVGLGTRSASAREWNRSRDSDRPNPAARFARAWESGNPLPNSERKGPLPPHCPFAPLF